ncbi:MAG: hypothetical protein GY820_22050 [Gammaproteobacteria bacterium]|nr:hypothetical protein [Gammaproteobacteria bacterium]
MELQREAAAFTEGKQTQFNEALGEYIKPLLMYLDDNLHNTKELEDIKYHLLMAKLLCRHSSEVHGIK